MTTLTGSRPGQGPERGLLARLALGPPLWLTRVRGRSMEPALRDGQLVPTRRLWPTDDIRRGDLVLAESADIGRRVVKRVIGLPTEHITIVDGHVTANGRPLHEPYARPSTFNGQFRVPEGAYLLLGDNRDASDDSRLWANPYVPRDHLTGRLHQFRWKRPAVQATSVADEADMAASPWSKNSLVPVPTMTQ